MLQYYCGTAVGNHAKASLLHGPEDRSCTCVVICALCSVGLCCYVSVYLLIRARCTVSYIACKATTVLYVMAHLYSSFHRTYFQVCEIRSGCRPRKYLSTYVLYKPRTYGNSKNEVQQSDKTRNLQLTLITHLQYLYPYCTCFPAHPRTN